MIRGHGLTSHWVRFMTEVFLAGFFCGCFVDELANRCVALHRSPLAGPHIALHASQNPAIFIDQDFLSDCAASAPDVHLLLLLWPIVGGGLYFSSHLITRNVPNGPRFSGRKS